MDIKACMNRQYQSLSILPGIDVLWYTDTIMIMFVFLFWGFSIHFSAKNTEQQVQADSSTPHSLT
jgi:hypothetical protein